jgi:hypothetical protein
MGNEEMADGRNWTAYEIVDGETVPVDPGIDPDAPIDGQQGPLSDAVQAFADAPQGPDPEELAAAMQAQEPQPTVHNLERARDLLELAADEEGAVPAEGIQSFKDTDRRTMRVVVSNNRLYKQEVNHGE